MVMRPRRRPSQGLEVYDIHCHLLPCVDDGPRSLKEAIELARGLVEDGVTHAVATPHVFPGQWDNRRSTVERDCARLRNALAHAGVDLELGWAGEVRLTAESLELLDRDEVPWLGTFKGYRTMLLEMPDGQVPLGAARFVDELLARRVRPVLVHPERNKAIMERPSRLQEFVDQGCCVQVTAGSVVGQFGARAQVTAQYLIEQGWVSALASDAHNLQGRRPRMRDARDWVAASFGDALAQRLTSSGPAALCAPFGEAIDE